MTHSLSYELESQARAKIGERALILSPEVRQALDVLEQQIDAPNRYTRKQHELTIQWLVSSRNVYANVQQAPTPNELEQAKEALDRATGFVEEQGKKINRLGWAGAVLGVLLAGEAVCRYGFGSWLLSQF